MQIRFLLALSVSAILSAQPTPGSITAHMLPLGSAPSVIDATGNVYATSSVSSAAGVTPGAAQTQLGGGLCFVLLAPEPCTDAFIVKSDPSGNTVWATLLGGPENDYGNAIATDANGNVYIAGGTGGSFPTTPNAAIPTSTTSTTFAAKISADGSKFLYVTYLPNIVATANAITVDAQGNAYIAGQTTTNHACVVKISADGSQFVYSTVLAGSSQESAIRIVADAAGNAYITGFTSSPNFPVTTGAVQTQLAGAQNAFLTKLDPNGNILLSTFLGGSATDFGNSIAIDAQSNVYLSGDATSLDFPTTAGVFQPLPFVPAWARSPLGFFAKLSPDFSSIAYASYIPLNNPILALGASGDLYLAGGGGPGFPTTLSAPQPCYSYPGGGDVVIAHFDANARLLDATYGPVDQAMTLASDGSLLLVGEVASDVRFGSPGWVAPACMTATIFNSATLGPADVVPGEFVSLVGFGIGPETGAIAQPSSAGTPLTLGGVQVFFDGNPAPIVYAQSSQVNVQAPFELNGQSSTSVMLVYAGATFGPFSVGVRFADPGLFRFQPNVSAQAYAVNDDGTINGRIPRCAARSFRCGAPDLDRSILPAPPAN